MRILHVIPSLNKGGAERLCIDICQELSNQGVEVILATLRDDNAFRASMGKLKWQVVSSYYKPSISSKPNIDISSFMQLVDKFNPNIIHSHLFEAELVSRASLRNDIAYITHCHDNMQQLNRFSFRTFLTKKNITNFYERHLILKKYKECNNHFIAISRNTENYFKFMLPSILKKNVHLLHNAINFNKFNSVSHCREISEIRILNIGSFIPLKNQGFLIDILNEILKRGVYATVTFLGDGEQKSNVIQKVEALKLKNRVLFKGYVNNVTDYLYQTNLYVHTAWSEAFGLVLIEAMAAGLPVVALDGKGNRDIVLDDVNGIFIEDQDAALFAEKIIALMKNRVKYNAISCKAVEFARLHDIKKYTSDLLKLYEVVMNEKSLKKHS